MLETSGEMALPGMPLAFTGPASLFMHFRFGVAQAFPFLMTFPLRFLGAALVGGFPMSRPLDVHFAAPCLLSRQMAH